MFTANYIQPLKVRNTLLDGLFYDVGNLSDSERRYLTEQTSLEGSILLVTPDGPEQGVTKFDDAARLREAPGDKLSHFAVAGVGSSDLGAASLGRTLANHLREPVGVIVSGYGMADLFQEALGGWFFFGAIERQISCDQGQLSAFSEFWKQVAKDQMKSPDTQTLIELLTEEGRTVRTLLGHSKGCLSIAYALRNIASSGDEAAWSRAKDIELTTVGAVVNLPDGMSNTTQLIGSFDWFGGMNSALDQPHIKVPKAGHHLNTQWLMSLDLAKSLKKQNIQS
ncbi:hypothetical protein [Photobacterium sp. J15]|uniref:hypothetical protein n=1 Tax=Photobacterium sp. J15 TaxID=265901 RepID=UPI0007E48C4B|nr:hypothetical protein [Photobacterium sp. J15]